MPSNDWQDKPDGPGVWAFWWRQQLAVEATIVRPGWYDAYSADKYLWLCPIPDPPQDKPKAGRYIARLKRRDRATDTSLKVIIVVGGTDFVFNEDGHELCSKWTDWEFGLLLSDDDLP